MIESCDYEQAAAANTSANAKLDSAPPSPGQPGSGIQKKEPREPLSQSAAEIQRARAGPPPSGGGADSVRERETPPDLSAKAEEKINKLRQISGMWKYQKIPQNAEPSLERRTDEIRARQFWASGGSVRGKKHIHGGGNCDDYFALRNELDGAVLLIAVSDGAGSRKFSRIGSRVSCEAALDSLEKSFCWFAVQRPEYWAALRSGDGGQREDEELRKIMANAMLQALSALYDAYQERFEKPEFAEMKDIRDLSATLLLGAFIPSETGEHTAAVCQVGDGIAALLDTRAPFESSLTLMGVPDSGEYAGETEFLTSLPPSEETMGRRTVVQRTRFDTVFMMTDGVADDYFPAKPEIIRLYCDLTANGILPLRQTASEGRENYRPVPNPLAFPSIQGISEAAADTVPVNYTWLICDALHLPLKDLWKAPAPLADALRLLPDKGSSLERGQRLLRWLENYAEAASFDDRTLVIAQIEGGAENGNQAGQAIETGKAEASGAS